MKKLLAIVLVVVIGSVSFANIVEFFESIPPVVKYGIGAGIALYGLSWACSWIFDPIVVVTDTKYGAYNFGPFIVVDSYLWYDASESSRNLVLNHEYVHYVQHALYGPILSLSYPVFALYSTLKIGNQWEANYWELQAIELSDCSKPAWQPSLVIELE